MKKIIKILSLSIYLPIAASLIAAPLMAAPVAMTGDKVRIVSAGSGITETVYALGAGNQIIAVDLTSTYPAEVNRLPKLGYHKQMSAEGILNLKPTVLIGTDDMGPPATITQLENAGLAVESFPLKNSAENIHERISGLATLLGKEQEGEDLWNAINNDLKKAQTIAKNKDKPKVVFLLTMGGRTPSVAGGETAADALIEMAGGNNPAQNQFTSYKPISTEALLTMAPDVIIYSDRGQNLTPEQLLDMEPILKQTPAGKSGRLMLLDGGLLLGGLGPRTGETVLKLAKVLYPDS